MATTFTLQTSAYDGRYMKLTCSQTKDVANNTSTISWKLESIGGSVNYYYTGPTTLTIGGVEVYTQSRVGETFPGSKGSVSGTLKVSHNTDGSKSVSITLSTAIYYKAISSYSGTWTMDSNPRKATIIAASDFNDEVAVGPTVSFSNPAGNNVTKLEICIAADGTNPTVGYKTITNKTGTSYQFTLTNAERVALRKSITSGSSRKITYILRTTIGSYVDTHKVEKTLTLINHTPVVAVGIVDNNPDTVELTGNSSVYIKGHSTAQYVISATPRKEATITGYLCNGAATNATDAILNVSSNPIILGATDSRGNTTTQTVSLSMIDYVDVSCSQKIKIELDGETTAKITVSVEGHYFNGSFGNRNNELFITVYYKEVGASSWAGSVPITEAHTPTYDGNAYSLTAALPTVFDYSKAYVFETVVEDALTSAYSGEYPARLTPVFDWSNNDFKFNVPVKINGDLVVSGTISGISSDYIVEQGTKSNWTYRKWNSGVMECWRRLQITQNVSSTWGSLYTSGSIASTNLTYPFAFTETPMLTTNLMPFGSGGILMASGSAFGSATQTGPLEIARGTSASGVQFLINYYAIGRWK